MTGPEQVSVNVADLRVVLHIGQPYDEDNFQAAANRLATVAAVPEPEWEPTDEMRAKYRRFLGTYPTTDANIDRDLKALHREELL